MYRVSPCSGLVNGTLEGGKLHLRSDRPYVAGFPPLVWAPTLTAWVHPSFCGATAIPPQLADTIVGMAAQSGSSSSDHGTGWNFQIMAPVEPSQNAFIERFNRTYRYEILDAFVFESLADVRALTTDFLLNYNTRRPHDSLGRVPPLTFLPRPTATDSSSYAVST